jgi:hypothetical protein
MNSVTLCFAPLWIVYIGNVILAKMWATATEYVLALATLGDATRNRNNPISVAQPKVAKARTMVSVACGCRQHYHDKLCLCKYG